MCRIFYVCLYMYAYVYVYIYICVCVCVCVCKAFRKLKVMPAYLVCNFGDDFKIGLHQIRDTLNAVQIPAQLGKFEAQN